MNYHDIKPSGYVERVFLSISAVHNKVFGLVFDQFDESNGDLVACVLYLLFCSCLCFTLYGWILVPFVIPAWAMITFDGLFAIFNVVNFISYFSVARG